MRLLVAHLSHREGVSTIPYFHEVAIVIYLHGVTLSQEENTPAATAPYQFATPCPLQLAKR